jgi:hypothetical protein
MTEAERYAEVDSMAEWAQSHPLVIRDCDNTRDMLLQRADKAASRRFDGAALTGFGELHELSVVRHG